MLAAVLTTLLFSLSAIFGRRVSHWLSGSQANLARLVFAATLLGMWSHTFGFGIHGRAFPVLFLSGCIGFGFGDMAMFQAYRHIGTRRTVVIIQCLAAPLGTFAEWLWLGRAPTLSQAVYGCVILAGVGIALLPPKTEARINRGTGVGILFGVIAAIGQAGGAVLSRKAYEVASAAGEAFHPLLTDGINAAYQRMLGGIAVSICFFLCLRLIRQPPEPGRTDWNRGWPWLIGHALAGPAAGVTCFQWALMVKPTNIVLPVVATTPLVVLPLAHFFEGEHVTRRAILGSAVAVAGVIGLVQVI
jgi:drug/metabolite transporter (DMT)-like permease